MSPVDVVSCIYSVYLLGFWTPKFRRCLGYMLRLGCLALDLFFGQPFSHSHALKEPPNALRMQHVRAWRIPAARLRDVLPALHLLQLWPRLPGPLQRAVWRIAPEELQRGVPPPPKADRRQLEEEPRQGWERFRLQKLQRGALRRIVRKARRFTRELWV